MKTFKGFIRESSELPYGDLIRSDDIKASNGNDKLISHFKSTGLMKKYEDLKAPDNAGTLVELNHLNEIGNNVTDEDLQFALNAEVDESKMYRDFIKENEINLPHTFVDDIFKQTDPIVMYLKKYHDRSRPEQFASTNNIPFQVKIAHAALHPAYPSGHAFDSHIMAHYLKRAAPHKAREIEDFARRMRESRLNVGLHYPSDNVISKLLADDVIKSGVIEHNIQ